MGTAEDGFWIGVVGRAYLRMPRRRFFTRLWRSLRSLRFGLLMMNVPLPIYSVLYNFSSAKGMLS